MGALLGGVGARAWRGSEQDGLGGSQCCCLTVARGPGSRERRRPVQVWDSPPALQPSQPGHRARTQLTVSGGTGEVGSSGPGPWGETAGNWTPAVFHAPEVDARPCPVQQCSHALCCFLRRQLPGPARHELRPGHQGEPVHPLVLQQGLLPLLQAASLLGARPQAPGIQPLGSSPVRRLSCCRALPCPCSPGWRPTQAFVRTARSRVGLKDPVFGAEPSPTWPQGQRWGRHLRTVQATCTWAGSSGGT